MYIDKEGMMLLFLIGLMSFDNVVSAYGSSHFVDVVHIEIVDVFCFV